MDLPREIVFSSKILFNLMFEPRQRRCFAGGRSINKIQQQSDSHHPIELYGHQRKWVNKGNKSHRNKNGGPNCMATMTAAYLQHLMISCAAVLQHHLCVVLIYLCGVMRYNVYNRFTLVLWKSSLLTAEPYFKGRLGSPF